MMVQSTGGSMLVLLMQFDRPGERDSEWLLFGPTDETVVESRPMEPSSPATPCGFAPSTGRR